ncbi:hypothetical protein RKD27_000075 [Streptomyces sp. SAI-126]
MAGIGAAINTGVVGCGDSVAVIGCGGVGDAAVVGSRLVGAAKIIAVDIDDRKLATATSLGATHTVNSRETDPVEAVRGMTEGFGADVVIEAVGRPEMYRQAFYARDLAGTVVLVGVPTSQARLGLPLLDVFGRGCTLRPSWYGDCLPSTVRNGIVTSPGCPMGRGGEGSRDLPVIAGQRVDEGEAARGMRDDRPLVAHSATVAAAPALSSGCRPERRVSWPWAVASGRRFPGWRPKRRADAALPRMMSPAPRCRW